MLSFFETREARPVSMEFEHTYPPYASYALLRLFIYLKKKKGKTNTIEGRERKLTKHGAGFSMSKHRAQGGAGRECYIP
jgi:hypothetical protein